MIIEYTEHSVNSHIASGFSGQIANSNAGGTTTLQSMGAKQTFHCHFLNIGPMNKQLARKQFSLGPKKS